MISGCSCIEMRAYVRGSSLLKFNVKYKVTQKKSKVFLFPQLPPCVFELARWPVDGGGSASTHTGATPLADHWVTVWLVSQFYERQARTDQILCLSEADV